MSIKNFLYLSLCLMIGACSSPHLTFEKEPVTGSVCCKVCGSYLLAENNRFIQGQLSLKRCAYANMPDSAEIQGILNINSDGKKVYSFTSESQIYFLIHQKAYPLRLLTTFNKPSTYVEHVGSIGILHDYTAVTKILLIPLDVLAKVTEADDVSLILEDPTLKDHRQKSSRIVFKFNPKNLNVMREFKTRCIDQKPKMKE